MMMLHQGNQPDGTRRRPKAGWRATMLALSVAAAFCIEFGAAAPLTADPAPQAGSSPQKAPEAGADADGSLKPDPRDWLFWRGPQFNGTSGETGLLDNFDAKGGPDSNVAWKREDLGGRSTPVIMDGRLYTLCRAEPGTAREGERVVCVDAITGESIWEHSYPVYLSDVPDTRVGWSAVVADPETASVFALSVCGLFHCLDARTGEVRWSVPMHERFGLLSTYGGRTNFPVVFEDLVMVSGVCINWGDRARPADSYVAFDKRTGEVVWFQGTTFGPEDTTYSSGTVTVLNQQRSLVFGSGDGAIWSFQARTGRPLWHHDISLRGVNAAPCVIGDVVYAGHAEENITGTAMGAVVAIDTTKAGSDVRPAADAASAMNITDTAALWRVEEIMVGRSQPLHVDGRVWVFDDRAKLWILDARTGETVGRRIALGRTMFPSALYADGKVYAFDADGRWSIYRSTEGGAETVNKGQFPRDEEVNGSPSCSHGRIYIQTSGGLYCLHDPNKESGFTPLAPGASEPSIDEDRQPFHVQVVPADILMKPGEQCQLRARVYNVRGQLLGEAEDVRFEVVGPGTIGPDGIYAPGPEAAHRVAEVKAYVGELTGKARVRIVPDLPWHFDFDDGQIPATWVGARYRHVPLDDDLLQSLQQSDPLAAQLYIYFHSSFVNGGTPTLTYDNTTPAQRWTALQRFIRIDTVDLAEAQRQLDPALSVLTREGVLSGHNWQTLPGGAGIRLTVEKGNRQYQGNVVMTKITTIPKGTRSRCWFGHSDLSNYTVQADVRGESRNGATPDIGLIAQGYTLDMMGEHQALQIRSWDPQLRMARTVDFAWEPNRWYTMKFQASVEGDRAILRGKVWPRDESEPAEWMVEATDDRPVRSGSPGLFGNANVAGIFLDNIHVTKN